MTNKPVHRPPAPPVVQAKAARPAPPPPPTRFGPPGGGAAQPKAGAGYRLVLGAYMHQDQALPPALAGHGFVAIERPDGRREAFGFSPAGYHGRTAQRDLAKLNAGVPGRVHGDAGAFAKPGAVTRSVAISPQQAQAALAKVAEYRHRPFSASRCQCTDFAKDVARAAGVDAGPSPRDPRAFYDSLKRKG